MTVAPDDDALRRLLLAVLRRQLPGDVAADLVPEAFDRVRRAADRIESGALVPYAVVIARNLARDELRRLRREQAHPERFLDVDAPPDPADVVILREEHEALRRAVEHLDERDRALLYAHDVEERPLDELSATANTSPGALAVRLSRLRARLRVEYVVALRRVTVPESCRSVMISLSAGDRKRQAQLRAGDHLFECARCAQLAPAVMTRRRPLVVIPFVAALRRLTKHHGTQAGVAAGAAVAAVAVFALMHHPAPTRARPASAAAPAPPASLPAPTRSGVWGPSGNVLPLPPSGVARLAAEPVIGANVPVFGAVPRAGGFWIGTVQQHLWVRLVGANGSSLPVTAGDHINFIGRLVANDATVIDDVGDQDPSGLPSLQVAARHVDVSAADLHPAPPSP